MKTPEQVLDDQLHMMHECRAFLLEHVPGWEIDAWDPVRGLDRGTVSCAAKSAIAVTYLGIRGMNADFAFRRPHGQPEEDGKPKVGHALALADPVMPFMRIGIDSFNTGMAEVAIVSGERLAGYQVASLEEGYSDYCGRLGLSVSLDGLVQAVESRM